MTAEPQAAKRKQRVGTVVSDHGDKTIVVSVERASRHRLYRKVIRRTKRYHVHDEDNNATNGDLVRIEETRPMSATKRWRLIEVLTERIVSDVAPESIDEEFVSEVQRTAARASAEEGGDVESAGDGTAADAADGTATADDGTADDGTVDAGTVDAGGVDAPAEPDAAAAEGADGSTEAAEQPADGDAKEERAGEGQAG